MLEVYTHPGNGQASAARAESCVNIQKGKRFAETPRVVKASAIHLEGKRFAETGRPAVHLVRAVKLALATVVFLE